MQSLVAALLLAAMLVFTYTVAIGILNGTDVVDFDRKTLLSHVHAGTLGWITMGIFAASLWLFGADRVSPAMRKAAQVLAILAVIALPAFAFTFALTYGTARPILGTFALIAIAGFTVWALIRLRDVQLSVPHLAFLAALVTSVMGGVLGVLLATEIARGWNVGPDGIDGAHPGTMVIGFLTPVGMGLIEWGLRRGNLERLTRLGIIQVAFPFVGALLLMTGLLLDITALPPLGTVGNLVGIAIMVWRLWKPFREVSWLTPSMGRYAAASAIALIASTLFVNYLAARYEGDFDLVPTNQLLAMDHMMFIGVLTNAIFVLLFALSGAGARFPRVDQVVFVGINVGLIGFAISLLAEATPLMRAATPIMGLSILLGLAMNAVALLDRRPSEDLPSSIEPMGAGGS